MKCKTCDRDVLSVPLIGQKNPDGSQKMFDYAYCQESVRAFFDGYDLARRNSSRVQQGSSVVPVPQGDSDRPEQVSGEGRQGEEG